MKYLLLVLVVALAILLEYIFQIFPTEIENSEFKARYGPWCVVAGASEGLGEQLARQVASKGLNVVLVARTESKLLKVASSIRQDYLVEVQTVVGDLSKQDIVETVKKQVENLEIGSLIYNAAFGGNGLLETYTDETISQTINVNVNTLTYMLRDFVKKFKVQRRGGILIISSLAAVSGIPKFSQYAATKSYQTTLVKGVWEEVRSHNVDVVVTVPGAISTRRPSKYMTPQQTNRDFKPHLKLPLNLFGSWEAGRDPSWYRDQ
ncbi:HSD17B3 [Acrasis kona]|uniref:HSD17B3 n=1 Tax=Acrasis kona TaxID=1008807 RepID=A0AAW2YS10_9EUKA